MELILQTVKKHPFVMTIIASVIAGIAASLGHYFTYKADIEVNRAQMRQEGKQSATQAWRELYKTTQLDMQNEINALKVEIKEIRKVVYNQNARIAELEDENRALRDRVKREFNTRKAYERFLEYAPGPMWFKTIDFRMGFINKAYEKEWGVTKAKYEGQLDTDVWGESIAKEFRENDLKVIECLCGIVTYEYVPRRALEPVSDKNPALLWLIHKWHVEDDEGVVIGVAGEAIEVDVNDRNYLPPITDPKLLSLEQ